MAPPKKPAARRQRRNDSDVGLIEIRTPVEVPAPSDKWLAVTRHEWLEFWEAPQASLVMPADAPALRRLFSYRDELERCARGFAAQRLVEGSTGQPRVNPLGEHVIKLEKLVGPLEDRFGLTPLSRLRLGVVFGEATQSLEAAMSAVMDDDEEDDGDDPRLRVIDVG